MLSGNAANTLAERMLIDFDAKVVAKFSTEQRIRNLAEGLLEAEVDSVCYTAIVSEIAKL